MSNRTTEDTSGDKAMSYCKPGPESDLYIWSDGDNWHVTFGKLSDLLICVTDLSRTGHRVPNSVFRRILAEMAQENGADK